MKLDYEFRSGLYIFLICLSFASHVFEFIYSFYSHVIFLNLHILDCHTEALGFSVSKLQNPGNLTFTDTGQVS